MIRVNAPFKSAFVGKEIWRSAFPTAMIWALLIGFAFLLGGTISILSPSTSSIILGAMVMLLALVLRQNQVVVMFMVAVHIYIDWYLGLSVVAQALAAALLFIFFLARSPRSPWEEPRALWLWIVLLILAIPPTIRGGTTLHDLSYYYPNIFIGALTAFWLGTVIACNTTRLRRFFDMLAILGTLLAIMTLIQAKTGVVPFASDRLNTFLVQVSNFQLANSTAHRTSAYFINPDWNGAFFCLILFLPLGLLTTNTSLLRKLLYFGELALMLLALLSTYSIGAWVGTFAGTLAFLLFVGPNRYRILIPSLLLLMALLIFLAFPTEVGLQLRHASNPTEVSLRTGAWQTAIRMIQAFPLTGIGLGLSNYLVQTEPYRASTQYVPLAHPHNSYLELGAMAGLPVLLTFVALLLSPLWQAWRNWLRLDVNGRSLLAGGIAAVIALSINSLSINGWTLPPLAEIGWLVLGAISSPLIMKNTNTVIAQKAKPS